MAFRILGPLEVSANGPRVEIGGRKQRARLASLLLHADQVVSARVGRGESSPDFTAVYGAQAAEILLDAIARS